MLSTLPRTRWSLEGTSCIPSLLRNKFAWLKLKRLQKVSTMKYHRLQNSFWESAANSHRLMPSEMRSISVPQKFRFPFFTELHWYALDKYVFHLMGRSHLDLSEETKLRLLGSKLERQAFVESIDHPHITAQGTKNLCGFSLVEPKLSYGENCLLY